MKKPPFTDHDRKRKPAGRRSARFLAVFLSLLLAASVFTGCGAGEEEQLSTLTTYTQTEGTFTGTVLIGTSQDTPSVAPLLEDLPEYYSVESYGTEKELRQALAEGRVQMAVLTPGGAAAAYKSSGGFTMLSPVYLGGYRLVGIKRNLTILDPYRPVPGGTAAAAQSSAETGQQSTAETAATDAPATVPHDPVEAGQISADSILPSQLRNCKVNVWHDTDTLIDLAAALGLMDGMSGALPVIRRYEEETPQDYLTEYNHFALTNICTAYGGQEAFVNKDVLLDVDAYWQAMTDEPLPSAVLVVANTLLEQGGEEKPDAAGILTRDFEAAMAAVGEQSGDLMRIVFYGTSNRGDAIMRTYYQQVYGLIGAAAYIPDGGFYLAK